MKQPTTNLLAALRFAAAKHRKQRRKDAERVPYINHLIEVADILARVGGVTDIELLQAAVLHDTVEDTDTTPEEIEKIFGADVRDLVMEVTDDKSLPDNERKQRQVDNAPHKTPRAKQLKIADKISNIRDITHSPPHDWSRERRLEYVDWGRRVVEGCRGVNAALDAEFDAVAEEGERRVKGEG